MLIEFWKDLASDGYSQWFALALILSLVPLAWDIWKHGLYLDRGIEDEE